jgi:glycerol transport system ATP-binding protein
VDGAAIPIDGKIAALARNARGKLELGIRPIYLQLSTRPVSDSVPARVRAVQDQGSHRIVILTLAGHTIRARLPGDRPIPEKEAWLSFPAQWIRLFADGKLIR